MFACIFIPDFPAQAVIRLEPELRVCPLAVLTGRAPLEKVMALNEYARELGVDTGASKSQLEAWETLVFRSRSEAQEASAQAALLDCAQSFSPEVEDTAPGISLLNLAGLTSVLGPVQKIAHDMAERILQMGLEAHVAVASNPNAALLAARGFPGVTLISRGHEAEQLGDLPVDVLLESFSSEAEQSVRWVETFDRWGIRKVRALAALPEVPLIERLGQQGLRLQKLARGSASRDLHLFEPRSIFTESVDLEYPIVLLEPLAFLLNRMLEQMCARLSARALALQELRLELQLAATPLGDCESSSTNLDNNNDHNSTQTFTRTFTRTLRLPLPMLDAPVLLKLLQLDLQAHPPGAPIVKIRLTGEPARPRALQSGLFQPVFPEPEKLELTLARIAGIVGEGRVGSVELLNSHSEGAFAVRHFAPMEMMGAEPAINKTAINKAKPAKAHTNTMTTLEPEKYSAGEVAHPVHENVQENAQEQMSAFIALRLFRPPLIASVVLQGAKPVRMRCLEREDIAGEIIWTAGPWRSSGDWAEQDGWSRDEWDIAVPAGTSLVLYRLVQDKLNGKWFLEGMYD
jgi:protein ImuB